MSPDRQPDAPGSTVRYGTPWADPPSERDPVRQARARLPAPVTVWTSGQADWAGLTVSSLMLAQGQPSRLVGLINPESDLAEMIEQSERFVVHLLGDRPDHRRLAQHFAGSLEAPAEWLQIEASAHGPRLVVVADQLACRLVSQRPSGWSQLVEAEVEDVQLGDPHLAPRRTGLIWYRGGFRSLPPQA